MKTWVVKIGTSILRGNEDKSTEQVIESLCESLTSFILKGNINHFDTKQNKWIPLSKGDVQIIRSGNGISHAEEINDESEIFQIWFDPDLSQSLNKEASYDDFRSSDFKIFRKKNFTKKIIKGDGSPLQMDSEGVSINEYVFSSGTHSLKIKKGFIHSIFILEGNSDKETEKY